MWGIPPTTFQLVVIKVHKKRNQINMRPSFVPLKPGLMLMLLCRLSPSYVVKAIDFTDYAWLPHLWHTQQIWLYFCMT